MPSSNSYLYFILEQLSNLEDITYKKMMGEYILYYKGKIFGGIYDNRFLIKTTKSAISLIPTATLEAPYNGAKKMIKIDEVDNKAFLTNLVKIIYDELPNKN